MPPSESLAHVRLATMKNNPTTRAAAPIGHRCAMAWCPGRATWTGCSRQSLSSHRLCPMPRQQTPHWRRPWGLWSTPAQHPSEVRGSRAEPGSSHQTVFFPREVFLALRPQVDEGPPVVSVAAQAPYARATRAGRRKSWRLGPWTSKQFFNPKKVSRPQTGRTTPPPSRIQVNSTLASKLPAPPLLARTGPQLEAILRTLQTEAGKYGFELNAEKTVHLQHPDTPTCRIHTAAFLGTAAFSLVNSQAPVLAGDAFGNCSTRSPSVRSWLHPICRCVASRVRGSCPHTLTLDVSTAVSLCTCSMLDQECHPGHSHPLPGCMTDPDCSEGTQVPLQQLASWRGAAGTRDL